VTIANNALPRIAKDIVVRRLAPTDLHDFQSYRNDPQVALYQGWSAQSDADAANFIDEAQRATLFAPNCWCQIGIALRESDTLIGDIGLFISGDALEAEIGFSLHRGAQGRGLAKQAVAAVIAMIFEHTPARRLIGVTDARNTASIKLMQALSMVQVATSEAMFKGEACTELTFALDRAP
jgi:RimJ/RimL family protein N-acetyltransferase